MFPHYFGGPGEGSVWSQPDQAALFSVLTAGWALALGLVLAGPARARLGAGVAVGLAVTELGFRLTDVGEVLRFGGAQAAIGMWLMTGAWLVGAAGAVVAVLAVRRRAGRGRQWRPSRSVVDRRDRGCRRSGRDDDGRSPCVGSGSAVGARARSAMGGSMGSASRDDCTGGTRSRRHWIRRWRRPTWSRRHHLPTPARRSSLPAAAGSTGLPVRRSMRRAGPTAPRLPAPVDATAGMPVDATAAVPLSSHRRRSRGHHAACRSAATAPSESGPHGAVRCRPDHPGGGPRPGDCRRLSAGVGPLRRSGHHTGRSLGFSLGNAFSGPWPVVIGNVVVAAGAGRGAGPGQPAARPEDRRRHRGGLPDRAGVAVHLGDRAGRPPRFPSVAGLTPAQSDQLGLQLHLSLTGWFTLDVLAAYALFAAVMVIGYLRLVEVQASSAGTWPSAPEARSPASLPWS